MLWDVNTTAGREVYGERYVDVWTIDKFHQMGASDLECDHFHGEQQRRDTLKKIRLDYFERVLTMIDTTIMRSMIALYVLLVIL